MKIPDATTTRGQDRIVRMIAYRREQIEKMEEEIEQLLIAQQSAGLAPESRL